MTWTKESIITPSTTQASSPSKVRRPWYVRRRKGPKLRFTLQVNRPPTFHRPYIDARASLYRKSIRAANTVSQGQPWTGSDESIPRQPPEIIDNACTKATPEIVACTSTVLTPDIRIQATPEIAACTNTLTPDTLDACTATATPDLLSDATEQELSQAACTGRRTTVRRQFTYRLSPSAADEYRRKRAHTVYKCHPWTTFIPTEQPETPEKCDASVTTAKTEIVDECTATKLQNPSPCVKKRTTIRRQTTYRLSPSAADECRRRRAQRARRRYYHIHQRLRPRKIVVVGDMCSGKSGLISAYCRDKFEEMYVPTILRSCLTDANIMGHKIDLVVVEVAGRDDYAKLRRCAYHKMDAVILCYAADNVASLEKLKREWIPELRQCAPNVPYILVGTKKDIKEEYAYQRELSRAQEDKGQSLRMEDPMKDVVKTCDGFEVAKYIGAHGFLECSALYRDGTREVFETAAKVALKKSRRRRKIQRSDACTIL